MFARFLTCLKTAHRSAWRKGVALFAFGALSLPAWAGLFDKAPAFLPVDEAFQFSAQVDAKPQGNQLQLNWDIADGYYLYRKEIRLVTNGEALPISLPEGEIHDDPYFGKTPVFYRNLKVNTALPAKAAHVEVHYQGCTEGLCYPPEVREITLDNSSAMNSAPAQETTPATQSAENAENVEAQPNATDNTNTAAPIAEQDQLAAKLSQNRYSVWIFFVLGLGLAFTPCVLPMLPLLSSIVIGQKQRPRSWAAFGLSLIYIQGMALTYTLLGLIVAAVGLPFQVALQSPAMLITLAILFTLLACSMFGLFEIKLPNSLQQKLNALSQKQEGGKAGSVFVMGMIAGLIASPCTSAPLSGALLYVAQSGDLFLGGLALYLLALGMGIPLVLVTVFGNRILPKSGDWLLKVKTAFGFVMLALPVFLITRVLPSHYEPFLWSALFIAFAIWLFDALPKRKISWLIKLLLIAGLGVSAQPWLGLLRGGSAAEMNVTQAVPFKRVANYNELTQAIAQAKGKKVMVDLYADWCVACKEFEHYTFSDAKVRAKLDEMVLLQLDLTENTPSNSEVMQKLSILGLPTILFYDENGNELQSQRVTGFLDAEAFLRWLNQL